MSVIVKRFTKRGSTAVEYSILAEAELVLKEARSRGGFIVDEGESAVVHGQDKLVEGHTYSVVPRIAGGEATCGSR